MNSAYTHGRKFINYLLIRCYQLIVCFTDILWFLSVNLISDMLLSNFTSVAPNTNLFISENNYIRVNVI